MSNILTTKMKSGETIAYIAGKITAKGLEKAQAAGKDLVRFTITVPTNDRELKNLEYNLGLKDAHIKTSGDKNNLIFVQVTAWQKTGEAMLKVLKAGDHVQIQGLAADNEYNGSHSVNLTVSTWSKDFFTKDEAPKTKSNSSTVSDDDLPF